MNTYIDNRTQITKTFAFRVVTTLVRQLINDNFISHKSLPPPITLHRLVDRS